SPESRCLAAGPCTNRAVVCYTWAYNLHILLPCHLCCLHVVSFRGLRPVRGGLQMDITGSYTLNAPRERVWDALLDPEQLRRAIPGCERLEREADNTYRIRTNVGIAVVSGIYEGTVRILEDQRPDRYRMIVDGKGVRGVLHGDGILVLEALDPNTTIVSYTGQTVLGGSLASVGTRMASATSDALVKGYFSRLADLL